jgi:hypothetical protein
MTLPELLNKKIPGRAVLCVLLFTLCNLIDAFGTLWHVASGAIEVNPLMSYLLGVGPLTFFMVKYSMGAIGTLPQAAFWDKFYVAKAGLICVTYVYFLVLIHQAVGLYLYYSFLP